MLSTLDEFTLIGGPIQEENVASVDVTTLASSLVPSNVTKLLIANRPAGVFLLACRRPSCFLFFAWRSFAPGFPAWALVARRLVPVPVVLHRAGCSSWPSQGPGGPATWTELIFVLQSFLWKNQPEEGAHGKIMSCPFPLMAATGHEHWQASNKSQPYEVRATLSVACGQFRRDNFTGRRMLVFAMCRMF